MLAPRSTRATLPSRSLESPSQFFNSRAPMLISIDLRRVSFESPRSFYVRSIRALSHSFVRIAPCYSSLDRIARASLDQLTCVKTTVFQLMPCSATIARLPHIERLRHLALPTHVHVHYVRLTRAVFRPAGLPRRDPLDRTRTRISNRVCSRHISTPIDVADRA